MAKGNPNDSSKLNNFVAKVYDPTAKTYRPIYVLPDATDKVLGGVYLSDSTSGTDKAATGVVAATPTAVKAANDNANTKLSKTDTTAQTVAGAVTFSSAITANKGVVGNASTATKLATARTITVKGGANGTAASGTFDGSANLSLTLSTLDATALTGLVPLASIPQGALERLVKVADEAARFKLTTDSVQLGDSVLQLDTGVMYVVIDQNNLANANGYQEYKASTALEATHATSADSATKASSADKATQDSAGQQINTTYIKGLSVSGQTVTYTKGNGTTGTITTQDTTYSTFKGATTSTAGSTGLVPAPAAGNNLKFLRGDGTWQVAGEVTGVKGNSETSYRVGNVNITPANVGALALTGGQLTGELQTSSNIVPTTTNSSNLGSSSFKWANVYATTFTGDLSGTATTANKLNKTVALSGAVTGSQSLNSTGTSTIATTLADQIVTTDKIADDAVTTDKIAENAVTSTEIASGTIVTDNIADAAVTTDEIADESVTLEKIDTDIGTVYTGTTEPTDSRVKIWVNI